MKQTTISLLISFFLCAGISCNGTSTAIYPEYAVPEGVIISSFSSAADMREFAGDNPAYFRGVCEKIRSIGAGKFMLSPGDIDPPDVVFNTVSKYIGSSYSWYPVTGNHEAETASDMDFIINHYSSLPGIVRSGPPGSEKTTYSFESGNVHIAVINEYYDGTSDRGTDGDVADALYSWLDADLSANTKPVVFVAGHEPAYPEPDADNGRLRHEYDSLNSHPASRDRFWNLLSAKKVTAYICGHTHNFSAVKINNVWQIDAGHARGSGDTGAMSTFVMFYIMNDGAVHAYVYREEPGSRYYLRHRIRLK